MNWATRIKILGGILISGLAFVAPVMAASYEISPASGNLVQNCTYELTIFADATSQSANAADLILNYLPSQIQVQDSIAAESGVQVQPGSAFQAYVGNMVDTNAGKVTVTAFSVNSNLTTKRPFIYLKFKPLTLGNIALQIQFNGVGNTLDSNIADSTTSLDLLTSITNANFNVITGNCTQDTIAPNIQFIAPTMAEQGFNSNQIQVQVSDSGSGVALNTVQITINGVQYNVSSGEVTYTQQGNTYLFTIILPDAIDPNTSSLIVVTAADNNGNNAAAQNIFNSGSTSPTPGGCDCTAGSFLPNPAYIFKNTFLENSALDSLVKNSVQNLGPASTTAILTGALSLITLLPYLPLLIAPGLLLNILKALFGASAGRKWGIVVSRKDQSTVAFAICRLYVKDTKNLVAQTVTDSKGRYGFGVSAGEYRLEVVKDGFLPTQVDLIVSASKAINLKVEIVPTGMKYFDLPGRRLRYELKRLVSNFFAALTQILMFVGFIFSLVGLFLNMNWINVLIFVIYALLLCLYFRERLLRSSVDSVVIDVNSRLRIGNIRLRIHSFTTGEVLDLIEVGPNGTFDYFGNDGEFGISLQSYGYKLSDQNKNLTKLKRLEILQAKLTTGGNKLVILVEQFTDVVDNGNNDGKLTNPFGS